MGKKPFKLSPEQMRPLVPGFGACIASDSITLEGRVVGLMYRSPPMNAVDTGWTFLAGNESEEYLANPDNLAVYDVNTIANYDPDVIPLLHHAAGSAFERDEGGRFTPTEGPPVDSPVAARSELPFVQGELRLSRSFGIALPLPFKRRIEDGELELLRPRFTAQLAAYANDRAESRESRLAALRRDVSAGAFDVLHESTPALERLAYRLDEPAPDHRRPAFYGFIVADRGHVLLATYFDDESDVKLALELWRGVFERRD